MHFFAAVYSVFHAKRCNAKHFSRTAISDQNYVCFFFFLKIRRFLRINDIQTRKIRKIRTIERWRILIVLRSATRSTNFESNLRIFTLVAHVSPRKLKLSQTETPIIDTRFEWFLISFVYYEISFSIVKMSQGTAPSNVCYKRIRLVFFLIFRKVWERIDFFLLMIITISIYFECL